MSLLFSKLEIIEPLFRRILFSWFTQLHFVCVCVCESSLSKTRRVERASCLLNEEESLTRCVCYWANVTRCVIIWRSTRRNSCDETWYEDSLRAVASYVAMGHTSVDTENTMTLQINEANESLCAVKGGRYKLICVPVCYAALWCNG